MELIFCFVYIILFFLSLLKKETRLFIFPIFFFCYPNKSSYINIGMGFGLDDIFILSHLFISIFDFKYNKYVNANKEIKNWKLINLIILLIYILSNILGFLVDNLRNFIFLDYFRTTLLFSYTYFICLIYIENCRNIENIRSAKLGLIIASVYQAIIAYLVFYNPVSFSFFFDSNELLLGGDIAYRAVGSLKGPWELGGFLAIGFILILSELFDKKVKMKKFELFLLIFSLMVILFSIVLSTSRASWLLVAGALLVFTIQNPSKILFYSVPVILLGILLFSDQVDQVIGMVFHRIEYTTSSSSGLDNSSMERFIIWERLSKEFNIFYSMTGYGWQNFIKIFGTTPHNGYLSAFLGSGIIGLLIYYKFFKKIYSLSSKRFEQKVSFGVIPIFIGLSIYSLTTDTLFTAAVFKVLTIIGTLVVMNYSLTIKHKET